MRTIALPAIAVLAFTPAVLPAEPAGSAPRPAPAPARLNNLVTALLDAADVSPGELKFIHPRDGWVFFRSRATLGPGGAVELHLDGPAGGAPLIRHAPAGPPAAEAMRFLAKGEHALRVAGAGERPVLSELTVRAIPEIIYANFPLDPHLAEYGRYDWAFLRKIGMLDSVNVIIGAPEGAELDEWRARGKRCIEQTGVPGLGGPAPAAEACAKAWSGAAGMTDAKFSGIIIDEFYPSLAGNFPVWIEGLRKAMDARPGRWVYPYIAGDPAGLAPFVRPLAASDACRFAYERYLREQPTEAAARESIEKGLRGDLLALEARVPNLREKMVLVLGLLCGPPETLNVEPAASFEVHMDMQFHLLANDPALAGLYGIEEYLVSYADEEYLRWAAKLYRHYCIEGRRDRLSRDPYVLSHIRNPDFAGGLEGWTVRAAAPGSVATRSFPGFGWLEGRWPRDSKGDEFLWAKRSAGRPNLVSQEIRGLEPGRAYSLKIYAADPLEPTRRQKLAVSARIDGADPIPDRCFHAVFASCYDHHIEKYGDRTVYFNFLRVVFVPRSGEAKLTISDWASDADPGGPAGGELICNFVEIEPYLIER